MLLQQGNSKLGKSIWTWTLPSGDKKICIGASETCLSVCYACTHFFKYKSVAAAHQKNYQISMTKAFVSLMRSSIHSVKPSIVRVHVGGDFYSESYVKKWIQIAKTAKSTRFFAYTRSWSDPEVASYLEELGSLPNFRLWWSVDNKTGYPHWLKPFPIAYLMLNDEDAYPYGSAHPPDIVFRDKVKTVMKRHGKTLVCPTENGSTKVTCTSCQLCFTDRIYKLGTPSAFVNASLVSTT